MTGTREELYRYAKRAENPNRRRVYFAVGKTIYPAILRIAAARIEKQYKLYSKGGENIPADSPAVIVAHHQTHQDIESFLVAVGKWVNTLVSVDGDSTKNEWLSLELTNATPILRGTDEAAKKQRENVLRSMVQKVKKGQTQLVFSEATYCPLFNDMLGLWKGSAVCVAYETGVPVIPAMAVYTPNAEWAVESCHIEFGRPFLPKQYPDPAAAARALRELMIEQQIRMNNKYNSGMTQADYSKFRRAQIAKFPSDFDYRGGAIYSLNFHLAKTPEEKAAIIRMFQENQSLFDHTGAVTIARC
jgi:1-acyl-sn-glycerol-3-phosphate acyltransferase